MEQSWINAIWGGVLIGTAVSLMLAWNGRVTGVSGILNGALSPLAGDMSWRISFLAGLLFGGAVLKSINPDFFQTSDLNFPTLAVAGILVGFGTVMGNGCTSGHGVCGVSRLSPRSIVATVVFILAGILSTILVRRVVGL